MLLVLGRRILAFITFSADLCGILSRACRDAVKVFRTGTRPVFEVFLKQLYFTGLQALGIILTIAIVIGIVIITQVINITDTGSGSLTGKLLVWMVVREIAPLLTAIIVIARSGTAMATELGQMKLSGEIETIEALGIQPAQYLVMPRILGVTAAVVILSAYFALASMAGGFLVASLGRHIPFELFSQGITAAMTFGELIQLIVKSACFGIIISSICCRQGLSVSRSATRIPQAATGAVIQSLFFVFLVDGMLTFLIHF